MINVEWRLLSNDNLLLCQFMVNYELRQGDYIVAIDTNDKIVAAGLLFHRCDGEAQVDVVVAKSMREQGLGRALVKQLQEQANQQGLIRLTAHSVASFWLALGFIQTAPGQFSTVLPPAMSQLVATWHDGIPMAKFMALDITNFGADFLCSNAQMKPCLNVHQSMFAGAIYSQAVPTGWGLVHLALIAYGLEGAIVLASGEMKYRRPITHNPSGRVDHTLSLADFDDLLQGKNCSINLSVAMSEGQNDQICATFSGRYVIIPVPLENAGFRARVGCENKA